MSSKNGARSYPCDVCQHISYTSTQRQRHKAQEHYCYSCHGYSVNKQVHVCTPRQIGGSIDYSPFVLTQAGLETFRVYSLSVNEHILSVQKLVLKYQQKITTLLENVLLEFKNIKARIVLRTLLFQQKNNEEKRTDLGSSYSIVLNKSEIKKFIFSQTSDIIRRLNIYSMGSSSWSVGGLEVIDVHVAKYVPLRGGRGLPTPICFLNKHGIINIPTEGSECFAFCAIACYLGIRTQEKGERLRQYKEFMATNFNDTTQQCLHIDFTTLPVSGGVSLDDIKQFTNVNELFSVNVFGVDEEDRTVYPIHLTEVESTFHMDLMLIVDEATNQSHYIYIYDFDLLLKRRKTDKRVHCKRCIQSFASVEKLEDHRQECGENPPQRLVFPHVPSVNYDLGANEIRHNFWVSADFETWMKPIHEESEIGTRKLLSQHIPLSYAYAYVGGGMTTKWEYYDGKDPDKHFVLEMMNLANFHLKQMSAYSQTMVMTRDDWQDYINAKECVLCKKPLGQFAIEDVEADEIDESHCMPKRFRSMNPDDIENCNIRVRHHYHGESFVDTEGNDLLYKPAAYRGAAHMNCNLQLKSRTHLTVVMHNFSNFDSKVIISGCRKAGIKDIRVLAKSSERFLTMEVAGKIRFIDSQMHLPQSLAALAETLKKSDLEKFHCTKQMLPRQSDSNYRLILSKQAFPYEYASPDVLDIKNKCLPPKEKFYSSIKNCNISDEDYEVANQIYKKFGCKSLRDYLRMYNILDVGILADVMEEHRRQCRDMYSVDPLNFLTLPSVSFNVGMSESGQTLDYIRDVGLYYEARRAIRGGVVNFSQRHKKANIPSMSDYDESLPETHITQLDINSLYSYAMTKPLPTRNFRKLSDEEVATFDISSVDVEGPIGYLVRVDVSVPKDEESQDFLKDLPPLPERIVITRDKASDFQLSMEQEYSELYSAFGAEQYVCTLMDKKNYTCMLSSLKQALDVGLKVEKIHCVWEFEQRAFLKEYVEKNVDARRDATCPSRKQTLKLMLNALYGRTSINTAKFRDFHIVSDHVRAQKLVKQTNFKSCTVIDEGMVLIEMSRKSAYINNHLLIGAAILDIARAYFYKVWYEIKRMYKDKVSLLYTDTDSFLFSIETNNLLESLSKIVVNGESVMDFSYLPEDVEFSQYRSDCYKGKVGKLKSETDEREILEVVVLRKKQYALLIQGDEQVSFHEKLRSTGLPHSFMKQYSFDTYKRTLFEGTVVRTKVHMLRSIHCTLYNILQERLSFTPISCSRYLLPPHGVETYPFGYYKIIDREVETILEESL